jgi:hypothetical protein
MIYQITITYADGGVSRMTFRAASDQDAFTKARAEYSFGPAIKSIVITDRRRS